MTSIASLIEEAVADAARADLEIVSLVEKLRRDLETVEGAVKNGLRVPSTLGGEVVARRAVELDMAVAARQRAYDLVPRLERVAPVQS